jgi:hypothetical protein
LGLRVQRFLNAELGMRNGEFIEFGSWNADGGKGRRGRGHKNSEWGMMKREMKAQGKRDWSLEEGRIEEQKFRRNWTESSAEKLKAESSKLKAKGVEANFYFER